MLISKKNGGAPEQQKATDQRIMDNIHSRAEKSVMKEYVYED